MKSKDRLEKPFFDATNNTSAKHSGAPDFTQCALAFKAVFTNMFRYMEGGRSPATPVLEPEVTLSNPAKWNPLTLHFSWRTPEGDFDSALHDAIHNFIQRVQMAAKPGLYCGDTTTNDEGKLIFNQPEDALDTILRIMARNLNIRDQVYGITARPGAALPLFAMYNPELDLIDLTPEALSESKKRMGVEIQNGAKLRDELGAHALETMPLRPYPDPPSAFAHASHAKDVARTDVHIINLAHLQNLIALARHKPVPYGNALIQ